MLLAKRPSAEFGIAFPMISERFPTVDAEKDPIGNGNRDARGKNACRLISGMFIFNRFAMLVSARGIGLVAPENCPFSGLKVKTVKPPAPINQKLGSNFVQCR